MFCDHLKKSAPTRDKKQNNNIQSRMSVRVYMGIIAILCGMVMFYLYRGTTGFLQARKNTYEIAARTILVRNAKETLVDVIETGEDELGPQGRKKLPRTISVWDVRPDPLTLENAKMALDEEVVADDEEAAVDVHIEDLDALEASEELDISADLNGTSDSNDVDNDQEDEETDEQTNQQQVLLGRRLRVAVYKGYGVSRRSWQNIVKVLRCQSDLIKVNAISDLTLLKKKNFDVVVVPGGIANKIRNFYRRKDESVKAVVKGFLKEGGGYVGVCAGAYLAGFLGVSPFSTAYVGAGFGFFAGSRWVLGENHTALPIKLAEIRNENIFYAYGPIFRSPKVLPKGSHIKNPVELLKVGPKSKLYIHSTPEGRERKSSNKYTSLPIVVASDFSKGRVVLSGTHQETDVRHSSSAFMDMRGNPSKCGSVQTKIFLNMVYYSAHLNQVPTVGS